MSIKNIRAVWEDYSLHLAEKPTDYDPDEVAQKLAGFFCPGPFYFYILDFGSYEFNKVSEQFRDLIGKDPGKLQLDDFLSLIHPDDIDFFTKCEARASKFLFQEIEPHEILEYKVSYCIRLKTRNGTYRLFLHQAMGVTLESSSKLGKVIGVHTDISHITTHNNRKLSFFHQNGNRSFTNIDVYQDSQYLRASAKPAFSQRELEIIRLLSEGAKTKDIAIDLSISRGTVRKHRENILKKAGVKNTSQLMARVVREGLI
jgi:DNA-binding CsgD family transcriptional regulator